MSYLIIVELAAMIAPMVIVERSSKYLEGSKPLEKEAT